MKPCSVLCVLALAAFPTAARAGVITGRVVDAAGNGVPGVNIDVDGSGGPSIANGGTNAGGYFTATITPDGVYDLYFEPPPPPATTHLVAVRTNVAVAGTVSLGDVALSPGVALGGRAVRAVGGAPVQGVNLDVVANGVDLPLVGDSTNAFGMFSIAVPVGPLELRLKTEGAALPLLAPDALQLSVTASTQVGDIRLEPGMVVSALVKRQSNGLPVVNADLDVRDSASGEALYTPGDNTDAAGFVDVVVPAGTYDIEVCPEFGDRLVAETLAGQVVASNKFLGTVQLQDGVVLSGVVQGFDGAKHAKVDVDLTDAANGAKVTLCGDDTDASGHYQVVVPIGVFEVEFTPPYSLPLGSQTVPAVVVTTDTLLDGLLPSCPFFTTSGAGKPGSGGFVPLLFANGGAPRLGNPDYALEVQNGLGGAKAFVLVWLTRPGTIGSGIKPLAVPTHVSGKTLSGPGGQPGAGALSLPFPIPHDPAFAGVTLHVRVLVQDPGAATGIASTHELQAIFCP